MNSFAAPSLRQSRHSVLMHGERQPQHGAGRSCAVEGCVTKLSRYNPSPTCAVHAGWQDTRVRQRG